MFCVALIWEWITLINALCVCVCVVLLGEPCRKNHRFLYVITYLNVIWQFWKVSNQNVWNILYGYNYKLKKIDDDEKTICFFLWTMKLYYHVHWARRFFILSHRASASEREWWCRSADKHRWTCVHRVWAPTNAAKRNRASYNRDKACCFRTNATTEPPLDQSWSYCCRRWAQLSVSWRTTTVIPWKWKKNRRILWRSSAVLKSAVSWRFSSKNRQCVNGIFCGNTEICHQGPHYHGNLSKQVLMYGYAHNLMLGYLIFVNKRDPMWRQTKF